MEVHQHTHSSPNMNQEKRRKWFHYFYEFLMLFLAVSAGFFVENMREHLIEHKREQAYIRSIAEDLKQDIAQLDSIISTRKKMDELMDSLLYLMNYTDPRQHGSEIYYYTRWVPRTYRFFTNDRTLLQLKNAGNWRLIRKQKVSDALAAYDNLVRNITVYIEQREEALVLILYQSIDRLFDNRVFEKMVTGLRFTRPTDNPQLLSYDKSELNEFCNRIHFRKNSNLYFIRTAETILPEAKRTLDLIREEYHL